MFYSDIGATDKRLALRRALGDGDLHVLPGAFNAASARLIAKAGAAGVYVSGYMLAADLGLPDLGLTTATEVAERGRQIARMVDVPTIIDADTGFGEPMNVARTVQTLEDAGLAGCHIEDQENPKRCGHSEGVRVVDPDVAVRRVRAAVAGRRDPAFVLVARTDARATGTLADSIRRAEAFVAEGADVIFPEALRGPEEYAAFRDALDVPLMINLNEFGRGAPLTQSEARRLGYNLAVYPVTLMRMAMGAAMRGLDELLGGDSQQALLSQMQTRDELHDLLDEASYLAFADRVYRGRPGPGEAR